MRYVASQVGDDPWRVVPIRHECRQIYFSLCHGAALRRNHVEERITNSRGKIHHQALGAFCDVATEPPLLRDTVVGAAIGVAVAWGRVQLMQRKVGAQAVSDGAA